MNNPNYIIASDRPWNRELPARLKARCDARFTLITGKEELTEDYLSSLKPQYVFFPHWSWKIPASVYERYDCVIFHMTDLPYGRGGSPLQNLIVRGHTDTVITALRCVEEMDAGPVYMKRPLSLNGAAEEIFLRADAIIEDMIVEIISTRPEPEPQKGKPLVFRRRRPQDGDLRQIGTLDELYDYIRMLDARGYPPAFFEIGPFRLEFSRASRRSDGVLADVRITKTGETHDE